MVWTPILQSESEGPSFIFRAARLLSGRLLQGLLSAPSWRTIVGVAHEAVAASFKLAIELVEHDITE